MGKVLYNQQFVERSKLIDIEDRGYQFGDGIYEVIGVYDGAFFLLDEHLQRLKRSAKEIQLSLPYELTELKEKLVELVSLNVLTDGVVYLQITRGEAERWHHFPHESVTPILIAYTKIEETLDEASKNGASAVLTEDIRWLRCDIKTLNLLPNVIAKQKAVENNAVEAILHRGDVITEASASNVFMVKDGKVFTHPANNYILNGITRQKVLELCDKLQITVQEEAFTIHDLLAADELFITATKLDIVPIIQVDNQPIGSEIPGETTKKIIQAFHSSLQALRIS
ncbi:MULTISPECIES: D-amino-acid transaminase [Virgibacillus]|uniref:D-alanine aminotransferase n=1 Tax=Virgibacillus massiliensis TaxID=1462526 RepID=A0A024QIA7_9BACI|nr:D-amino-acid transaminase [Virgibacillus massiliensis]CDQ41691.1 D-alanine aminotransferase [Virgibacillus massiliensis]